jgi:hypothetical protein
MKRRLLIFLFTLLILSCKKDESQVEPVPFRLLTRQAVLISSTNYALKGTIVGENKIQMSEYGFLYTSSTAFNSTPIDLSLTNTKVNKIVYLKNVSSVDPGNFEDTLPFVSKQYYTIASYAVAYNSATQKDEVYTGSQLQFQAP